MRRARGRLAAVGVWTARERTGGAGEEDALAVVDGRLVDLDLVFGQVHLLRSGRGRVVDSERLQSYVGRRLHGRSVVVGEFVLPPLLRGRAGGGFGLALRHGGVPGMRVVEGEGGGRPCRGRGSGSRRIRALVSLSLSRRRPPSCGVAPDLVAGNRPRETRARPHRFRGLRVANPVPGRGRRWPPRRSKGRGSGPFRSGQFERASSCGP